MPESKHRRKGSKRERPSQRAVVESRPEPSPEWVPRLGVGLLLLGVLVIVLGYIPAVAEQLAGLPGFGSGWSLIGGFVFMVAGFGVLTRWR